MWNHPYAKIVTTTSSGVDIRWYYCQETSTTSTWTSSSIIPPTTWYTPASVLDYIPRQRFRAAAPAIIRPESEIRAAAAKARQLLLSQLSPSQRREFLAHETITIHGKHNIYRLRKGIAANIDVLTRRGAVAHRLCVHPHDSQLPREDIMLSQLIHLQFNEDEILRRANVHSAPGANADTDNFLHQAEERLRIAA